MSHFYFCKNWSDFNISITIALRDEQWTSWNKVCHLTSDMFLHYLVVDLITSTSAVYL